MLRSIATVLVATAAPGAALTLSSEQQQAQGNKQHLRAHGKSKAHSHAKAHVSVRADGMAETPIRRVVQMLKDMQVELSNKAQEDGEVYEKVLCWCKENRNEKEASIAKNEGRSENLESVLKEEGAKVQEGKAKVVALRKQNREGQSSIDESADVRSEELKAFHSEEKSMLETITALKGAIVTLSKHHKDSKAFEQTSKAMLNQMDAGEELLMREHALLKKTVDAVANYVKPRTHTIA